MICGIGTDIVAVERVRQALGRRGEAFAKRILTPPEFERFEQHHQQEYYLAKRFAAKEAAAKALGTGIAKGIGFQQLQTANTKTGAPTLTLLGAAAELAEQKGCKSVHLSLSDEQDYVVAFVVLES